MEEHREGIGEPGRRAGRGIVLAGQARSRAEFAEEASARFESERGVEL